MSKRKAGYARQRQWHEHKRTHPNRAEYQLVQAIDRCRLDVVEYEYEVEDSGWHGWVNVAFKLGDQLCFIDMSVGHGGKKNRKAIERKMQYAEAHDIPFLEVKGGSVVQMQASIELWLLKLRRESRQQGKVV